MRRLYCDRCMKEVNKLYCIKVPYTLSNHGGYLVKDVEVCNCCKDFVEKAEKDFNHTMAKIRIAFFETLFSNPIESEK